MNHPLALTMALTIALTIALMGAGGAALYYALIKPAKPPCTAHTEDWSGRGLGTVTITICPATMPPGAKP